MKRLKDVLIDLIGLLYVPLSKSSVNVSNNQKMYLLIICAPDNDSVFFGLNGKNDMRNCVNYLMANLWLQQFNKYIYNQLKFSHIVVVQG